ncbi:MAG: hypothetical protein ABI895_39985 [Deltaproteobacteria bacterium]
MLAGAMALGDLDGDGMQDVLLYDDSNAAHLVYGAAGVFDSGIDLAQASATFAPFAPFPGANERIPDFPYREYEIGPAGDLDGDGDHELFLIQYIGESTLTNLVALLSGSSQRLRGVVELPTPSNPYPDPVMLVQQLFPIGDLDGDGVDELATRSSIYPNASSNDYELRLDGAGLNIHYGIRGSESRPPR